MTRLPGLRSIACTGLLSLAAAPALAQNRLTEVSVGASLLTEIHLGGALPGVTSSVTSPTIEGSD